LSVPDKQHPRGVSYCFAAHARRESASLVPSATRPPAALLRHGAAGRDYGVFATPDDTGPPMVRRAARAAALSVALAPQPGLRVVLLVHARKTREGGSQSSRVGARALLFVAWLVVLSHPNRPRTASHAIFFVCADVDSQAVKEQVDWLIQQATAHENLCQNYVGWCPFW
jgi:hypothetical protein